MARDPGAKRAKKGRLYDGDLLTRRGLQWMVSTSPSGIAVACRLPECSEPVMRKSDNRPKWFCGRRHADKFRNRRENLEAETARLEAELEDAPVGGDGRYSGRADRARHADLVFLRKTAVLYVSPDDVGQ